MLAYSNYFCMSLDSWNFVPKFGAYAVLEYLSEILFEICADCDLNKLIENMPAVPQGAFAACKVRERNMKIAKMQAMEQESEKMFYHGKYLELSPLKYNSKLMNSIWGLYNRYSVHNFKKITDAAEGVANTGSQHCIGSPASAEKYSAAPNKGSSKSSQILVSEWINIIGTHKH